jgi:ATP-dependent Lon protease
VPAESQGTQKRVGSAEFRNTQFSYEMADGIERFVVTPELQSEDAIGGDPLPPGQVWAVSPGGSDEGVGLYRLEATEGPGSGVRILNVQPPGPFRESVKVAEQNLYVRSRELVGDREPRQHELMIQLRALDAPKSGATLGVPALMAFCGVLLGKSLRWRHGGRRRPHLGGGIDPVHNAVSIAERAVERGATTLLVPVSARRQLVEMTDEMAAKLSVLYYTDAPDALLKALAH